MQNKYLSALGTKYANFGFSKEAFDRVASQRIKTIANESEIDQDIANPDTLFLLLKEMQGSNDALRTKVAQTHKELETLKNSQVEEKQEQEQTNPFEEKFEKLQKAFDEMAEKFTAREKKAHSDAIIAEVHAKMKSLGCTNDYIRNTTLANIEVKEGDTADSIAEKYKSAYDANCKAAFGNGYVPPKGGDRGGSDIDYSAMVAGLRASGDIPK